MKVTVVHRGARDAYQVAVALSEAGMLDRLVTDLYWPADRRWAARVGKRLPAALQASLQLRCAPALPSLQVQSCWGSGLMSFALERLRWTPFSWRQRTTRQTDRTLGQRAGAYARRQGSALLSYSYYGHSAFSAYGTERPAMLFQLHPHPASMRRILQRELADHPDCATSLQKEWELALPQADYEHLVAETQMAAHWLAASSFTKQTLVEHGADPDRVAVVPYGVDLERFRASIVPCGAGKLRLLFVGTINQRKGIKYLLQSLDQLASREVELMVCGRVVDDLRLFARYQDRVRIRPSVSAEELRQAYRWADLFVLPSVGEGFGHVLLEALASGLPVLSTTHTAAPDLVDEEVDGFVVPPRRPDLLAARIDWACRNRHRLGEMRWAARQKAERFTWQRFREGTAAAVRQMVHAHLVTAAGAVTNHV